MRRIYLLRLITFLVLNVFITEAEACPLPGTYTIGPTGNYVSINQAVSALNACTLTGAYIFELQPSYVSTVETFPIVIPAFNGASLLNSVTFRPQVGATNLSITTALTGTIKLNGAKYVYFDGRAGGTGSTKNLTIENTSITTAYTVQLIENATNNTFSYCSIKGSNTDANSGTIFFSTTSLSAGNNDNVITNCDIADASTGLPANAVFSLGTTSSKSKYNSNNEVSYCNIYNFYSNTAATPTSAGINLNASTGWIINANSFYQTATRNFTVAASSVPIFIYSAGNYIGDAYQITNNYIGGSAPNTAGTSMTLTGIITLSAIYLYADIGVATNVTGNVIKNISVTSSSTSGQRLIYPIAGSFNCKNNFLGDEAVSNSLQFTLTGSGTSAITALINTGALLPTTGVIDISGNVISGVMLSSTNTTAPIAFRAISLQGSPTNCSVTKNRINTISCNVNKIVTGIYSASSSNNTTIINDNKVENISQTSTGNAAVCSGIYLQSSAKAHIIKNDTVTNITSASTIAGYGAAGLLLASATVATGNIIDSNIVSAIRQTNNTSVATKTVGIITPSTYSGELIKNRIYDLTNISTNNTNSIAGYVNSGGSWTVANNMISVTNSANTNASQLYGIFDASAATGTRNYYFNSVYVGGAGNNDASTTYNAAFQFNCASGATANVKNNIFVMDRTKGAGSGNFYAIANKTSVTTGFNTDNNILNCSIASSVGLWGTTLVTNNKTFANWKTATNGDANSYTAEYVPFVNTATGDLHINLSDATLIGNAYASNIESKGTTVSITNDYDKDVRPGPAGSVRGGALFPDLGADEVDLAYKDDKPPVITYTSLSTPSCDKNQALAVSIYDYTGVPVLGTLVPRIYYRKNSGSWFSQPGVLATGTSITGTWNFTITITDMGGVVNGDIVSYYITAQDICSPSFYITALPVTGFIATNVNTVSSAPTTVNSYTVNTSLSAGNWLGINNNWADVQNWCGGIPVASTNVTVPTGISNYPQISSAANVNNISIATGASVTINNGNILTLAGTFNNLGTLINKGTVALQGTALQYFPGGTGSLAKMNNLTVNNPAGAVFNRSFSLSGTLNDINGNVELNNSVVTLRSGKDSTAAVGNVGGSFSYTGSGKFEVQRFFPQKRAWRLITAPVQDATAPFINDAWQEGANPPSVGLYNMGVNNPDPSPGFGTHITGIANVGGMAYNSATITAAGFDQSPQNNSSMKYFTGGNAGIWTPVLNTLNNKVTAKQGYLLFVRGDRSYNISTTTNYTTPKNARLRVFGKINTGTVNIPLDGTGFKVIGNPYPSAIKYGTNLWTNNNAVLTNAYYYLWDPLKNSALATPSNVGGLIPVQYIPASNTYTSTYDPSTDVSSNVHSFDLNGTIQSGAAFIVESNVSSGNFIVQESDKVNGSDNYQFKPVSGITANLRVNLYAVDNTQAPAYWIDGAVTHFDETGSDVNWQTDVKKFFSPSGNFAVNRNGDYIAIEHRSNISTVSDTLFYYLGNVAQGNYRLDYIASDLTLPLYLAGFVEDTYTGKRVALNDNTVNSINFAITADTASQRNNRFRIVFNNVMGVPLPVQFKNITAAFITKSVVVNWQVGTEVNVKQYVIERSTDGVSFSKVGFVKANGNEFYNWTDKNEAEKINYYRIISVDDNNNSKYSNIVKVEMNNPADGKFYLLTGIISNHIISLQGKNLHEGKYGYHLINNTGQVLKKGYLDVLNNTTLWNIPVDKTISAGIYFLEINRADGTNDLLKIMVQ